MIGEPEGPAVLHHHPDDVVRDVSTRLPGETISITVVRGAERKTVRVRLGARSDSEAENP